MKFMKLGSKPDLCQSDGDHRRYVATELATDIVVNVGEVKFYLHKFPLLSKCARLKNLIAASEEESNTDNEILISDIPGGPTAFEICVKFSYGMTVTLNAYNVVATRCAAEYLEMYETVEKGNLVYKIEAFLNSSIFRSWKDSIIVLQTTGLFLPWSEELKIIDRCIDSIASKASMDPSKVEWSYTYNRKKLSSETSLRVPHIPNDWWVEDLCDLHVDIYKKVISTIRKKGRVSSNVIGEALDAYANRRIPGFGNGVMIHSSNLSKFRSLLETIIWLLPTEKQSVSCSFLIKLLKKSISLDCGGKEKSELISRIGQKLEEATVADLLIRSSSEEAETETVYNVEIIEEIVKKFVAQNDGDGDSAASEESKAIVAKIIDGYLAEISRDPNLSLSKFLDIAETVSNFPRQSHDGVYRAIDMFLKIHPGVSKSEKKTICRLMDCRRLSQEACAHAVQNERLPLRVVVQILLFEQTRATLDIPCPTKSSLPANGPHGSSRTITTSTEDKYDCFRPAEDISNGNNNKTGPEKVKGIVMSRLFSKMWAGKERDGDISSSETSESPGSATADDKSTSPTCRRRSMS